VNPQAKLRTDLETAGLSSGPGSSAGVVSAADIVSLPTPVQRYMRFMRVIGSPRVWSFRVGWTGRFRRGPHEPWRSIEAWQYDTSVEIARMFYMRIRFFGAPVLGRDTYIRGAGRMLIRPFDLLTAQDATGAELDIGELVTFLNDAIFFAPSMLLGTAVSWHAAGDDAFDVSLTDGGRTVTARVSLDGRGAPRDFETTDRFLEDPRDPKHPLIRGRWTTPVDGWQEVDGRPALASGKAIWHLPGLEFAYAEMSIVPGSLAFNVPPRS